MSFTQQGALQTLGLLVGTYTAGANTMYRYIGLVTATPSIEGGAVVEPTASSYKRALIAYKPSSGASIVYFTNAELNAEGTAFEIYNSNEIHFNEALEEWGTCTHFAIFDKDLGGNVLYVGELTAPITPAINTVPLIRTGDLKITLM